MNATDTRERILERMFFDMRRHGFQGLRADRVVADLNITKGALYHYFPNKQAIGLAVIDEYIGPNYLAFYRALVRSNGNPIDELQAHLRHLADRATPGDISLGCPLNNLVQEMSPLDEDFRVRMRTIVDTIQECTTAALRRGQQAGQVRTNVDVDSIGQFFFASVEGAYSMAKVKQDVQAFRHTLQTLAQFLDTLRT